jgi:Zn-dependent protease
MPGDALPPRPGFLERGFSFWLLGFPITVKNAFWLVTLMLAYRRLEQPATFVEWVVVVTIAILIHELGHAVAGRAFGLTPVIVLHGMGGLTQFVRGSARLGWKEEVAMSAAGPGAGIATGILMWIGARQIGAGTPMLMRYAISDFIWVSIVWGCFNLLPLLPMDGGNVMAAVLRRLGRDWRVAYQVSVATAVLLGMAALALGETWLAILAALFGMQNWQRLKGVAIRFW